MQTTKNMTLTQVKTNYNKVCIITENGRKKLGAAIKTARKTPKDGKPFGWSQDELIAEIKRVTGFTLSKATISELERGNSEPKWDTLAILSSTGFLVNPRTGEAFSTSELFKIACEAIDPTTGDIEASGFKCR